MPLFNFKFDLDDATYLAALERARREEHDLEGLLADYLAAYAGHQVDDPLPPPSTLPPAPVETPTPEPAPAPQPAPEPTPEPQGPVTYTVQSGDTLSKIARRFYGDARKYPLIQQANNLGDAGMIRVGQVLVIPQVAPPAPTEPPQEPAPTPVETPTPQPTTPEPEPQPEPEPTPPPSAPTEPQVDPCAPVEGQSYRTLSVSSPPTDRPAHKHADLNLSMRGYVTADAARQLIDMAGPTDSNAPQLRGLFANRRIPAFPAVYRVHDWDWGQGPDGARSRPLDRFEVTLLGMATEPGEVIYAPDAGYSIGEGMKALVLYATTERITLKYTREDNVIDGYTLHIEGICVEPDLRALYERQNSGDRGQLPALKAGQALGRARGTEIKVSVRDKGTFMDPRTRKDWWARA